jgi:hypothetical protein
MSNDINLGKDWEIAGNDGGNLVIKDKQNGNTYTLKPDGEIGASSVNADSVATAAADITDDLNVTGEPRGNVFPAGKCTFASEFLDEPFGMETFDPEVLPGRLFDDGRDRLIIGDKDADNTTLYAYDGDSYDELITDILPGVSGTGQVAGAEILEDGRVIVMESTDSATDIHVGDDFSSLSRLGEFCAEPDGGTFYDRDSATLHYYPEDQDNAVGVGSTVISHFTAPDDDLLNTTKLADVFGPSGFGWKTGDPTIIKLGSWYYMFLDRTDSHPQYHIGVAAGRTLDSFTLIDSNITPERLGGDLTVVRRGSYLEGWTEYSGDQNTIGHWRLWPVPASSQITDRQVRAPEPGPQFIGLNSNEVRGEFSRPSQGKNYLDLLDDPSASNPQTGYRVVNQSDNVVGKVSNFDGDLVVEGDQGNLVLAKSGSGQQEHIVFGGGEEKNLPDGENNVTQSSDPGGPGSGKIRLAFADGSSWDPTGNGNAAFVGIRPDGTVETIHEFGSAV